MEIRDLKYFRTIVEAGGVTRAAAVLHMTPGALSKALQRFESDIGRPLFKRTGRALVVNHAGELLYERSARLLAEHVRLLGELDASLPPSPETLRIGTFEVFSTYFLGELLGSHSPDADVQVLDVGVGKLEEAVKDRTVDVGLTYVPFPDRSLHFRRLARIEFGIYTGRRAFEHVAVEDIPFAIPTNRLQLASGELLGIDSWPYQRVPRTVKYRLTMLQTALELSRRGLCAVFIPTFIAALHNRSVRAGLQLRRVRSPAGVGAVQQTVHLVTRNEDRDDPRVRELAAAARQVIRARP